MKKIVAQFFSPVCLCLGILILGLLCLWATRRQRLGKVLVTLGTVLLFLSSNPFLSSRLLLPLEQQYPALLQPEKISWEGGKNEPPPKWIVVLGGGHRSDPSLPVNSQISAAALGRVVEGVRLYKALPGSKLLLSGGGGSDPVPEAEVMAQIVMLLGVKSQDVRLEPDSLDTADQAEIIAKIIGKEKFILVTSAAHMVRSMALFRRRGMQPIPAPADFQVRRAQRFTHDRFFPDAASLAREETALHEYLGLVWAWLRGAI